MELGSTLVRDQVKADDLHLARWVISNLDRKRQIRTGSDVSLHKETYQDRKCPIRTGRDISRQEVTGRGISGEISGQEVTYQDRKGHIRTGSDISGPEVTYQDRK